MPFCVNCEREVSTAQAARHLAGDHGLRLPVLAQWAAADLETPTSASCIRELQREVLPGWRPWWAYWAQRKDERDEMKRRRGRGAMAVVR